MFNLRGTHRGWVRRAVGEAAMFRTVSKLLFRNFFRGEAQGWVEWKDTFRRFLSKYFARCTPLFSGWHCPWLTLIGCVVLRLAQMANLIIKVI